MDKRTIVLNVAAVNMFEEISGLSMQIGEDRYNILLNSNAADAVQTEAFLHECRHIWHRDFDRTDTADQIEAERHTHEDMLETWDKLNAGGKREALAYMRGLLSRPEYVG